MRVYKWTHKTTVIYKCTGIGHYFGATVICAADCMKSAKEIMEKALTDAGLYTSWVDSQDIEEIDVNDSGLIYIDDGVY